MDLLTCNEGDEDFNDHDAWVMEGEDITGERNAFDVSLMRTIITLVNLQTSIFIEKDVSIIKS